MGEIFIAVVGTMLEPIRDLLYKSIGRRFGYLVHYKKNIKDFADEVDKLSLTKARVQIKVDAAENNAEVLHDDVLEWRRKVQSMEDDKSRLLQSRDNLKCLDVCSRYRLGKEGKKKMPDVTQLIADGNNFGDVGYRRPPTVTFQKIYSINYGSFPSREFVFEEILRALKDDGTYKIGIHGMPGVGKTRMMEEVAQQAQKENLFDEVAQIVVSQNPILTDIQQKLAKSLNMQDPENASKAPICDRLRNGKRILIMVDDVWNNEIKLEDIGIPAADNHTKGCKIILTSRIKEVCLRMAEKEFEIGVLSEHEALDLFKKTVGDFTERPELHSIAEELCSECDCLPLAIVTVGKALQYQKEKMHAWNTALHQLKHSMGYNIPGVSKNVYSCIELSYQYLKLKYPMMKDLQPCFLHCCLFPEDAEISIDNLVTRAVGTRFLEGANRASMEIARDRTCTLIDILKESNLLLNGRDENFVKMHDVIRDVAISVASKEKDAMFLVKAGVEKWPDEDEYKQCKAISLRFNDACVLPDDSECPEVCTLMLEFRNLLSEVPSSFFKGMEKLEVLQLRNMQILELSSSLKNLRMLCLYNCKLVNVAFLKKFKKLEILCIEDSDIRELAPEIGQLTRLRLLDVRYCVKLKIIPSGVISSLSQLEELYIPDDFDQWEVEYNASLNELNSLKRLTSLQVYLPDVMLLSPLIEPLFKSLNRFQICIGSKLSYSEEASSATRILKVERFPLKKELNILMEYAEILHLAYLKENVPKGLFGSVSFRELRELIVHGCDSMIYLFSSDTARSLLQLQKLSVRDCYIMEEIVSHDQEVMDGVIIFGHLKKIELTGLPKLRSFYANMEKSRSRDCNTSTLMQALFNDKVAFPALEDLFIGGLKSLTAIWEGQSQSLPVKEAQVSFQSLRVMTVIGCKKLVNVIASNVLPSLQKLEKLFVYGCDSVEEIFAVERGQLGEEDVVHDEIIVFPQLKYLELSYLKNLKSFTHGSKEEEETVDQRVKALFNHKVAFPALEKLEICDLASLAAIWEGQSQSLLVKEAQVSFQSLRFMTVWRCNKLVNVIASNVLPSLQKLEKLKVSRCNSVEEIVAVERGQLGEEDVVHDEITVFPQLKNLKLECLPNFKSFTHGSKKSEETVDQIIPRVEALFNYKVAFPALEDLIIIELESLTAIWNDQSHSLLVNEGEDSFRFLKCIEVKRCNKLVNVIPSNVLPRLRNLEKLEVDGCGSVTSKAEVLTFGKGSPAAGPTIVLRQLKVICLMNPPYSMMYVLHELNRKEYSGRNFAYPNLKELCFSKCHSLRNVFSPSTTKYLVHLQKLEVIDCEKMEGIVAVERGQLYRKEDVVHEVIVFHQLKQLTLKRLPNLNSFYSICGSEKEEETAEQNFGRVEALFNYKVSLPALEELTIEKLQSLIAIWVDQSQPLEQVKEAEDSFRCLTDMTVRRCEKLVNVIPSYMLPRLQNLKELKVEKCDSLFSEVEVLGSVEKGSPTAEPTINVLPQLQEMLLEGLPNLVMYMRLNRKEHFAGGICAYSNLTDFHLSSRDNLGNVFSPSTARYLVHLQKLKIFNCEKMEQVVAIERGELGEVGEDDVVHDEIIVFPRLKYLRLGKLPDLKSFCCYTRESKKGEEEKVELNIPRVEALFNHKVRFPALKKLKIIKLQSLTVIWDNQLFLDSRAQDSFPQLRVVMVQGCEKLVNVIPPNAFPQGLMVFHSLKHLILIKCNSLRYLLSLSIARGLTQLRMLWIVGCSVMEEIVRSERQGEEDDMEEIVFTRLNILLLERLPNLACFCGTKNAFKFPSLKKACLRKCPQLQTFTTGCLSTPDELRIDYEGGECNDVIDLNDYVQQLVRREKGLAVDESPGGDDDDDFDDDDDEYDDYFGDFDDDDDDDDDDGWRTTTMERMMMERKEKKRILHARRRRRRRDDEAEEEETSVDDDDDDDEKTSVDNDDAKSSKEGGTKL